MTEPARRPDDDDYDLLTFGEASARVTEELEQRQRELEQLEERLFYLGEDPGLAEQIGQVQERIDALRATQARLAQPAGERIVAAIAESSRQLEVLEERMFYVPDDQLAERISAIEGRIEALHAAGDPVPDRDSLKQELDQRKRQLEVLEERLFYVGEDTDLAERIAATQRRIQQLDASQ